MRKINRFKRLGIAGIVLIICLTQISANTMPDELENQKSQLIQIKTIEHMPTTTNEIYREDIPLSKDLQLYLHVICNDYQVDFQEALAVILTENPTCNIKAKHVNKNGTIDYGLFQINSCNYSRLSKQLGIKDLHNPYENIEAGVYMLAELSKYDDLHIRYMSYNAGEYGAYKMVSRGITSTRYSRKVVSKINELKGEQYGR